MADIKQITLGSTTYNIKDETARNNIIKDSIYVDDLSSLVLASNSKYYIKSGTYNVDSAITATVDNVTIYGNGAVINNSNNSAVFNITGDNIEICDFVINNNKATYDVSSSIPAYGSIQITGNNAKVYGITINRVNKAGIYVHGAGANIFENLVDGLLTTGVYESVSSNNQQYGIYVISNLVDTDTNIHNNSIKNIIQGVYYGDNNFVSTSFKRVFINDNHFTDCLDHSIYCNGGYINSANRNICIRCGQITLYAYDFSEAKFNYCQDSFDDSNMSAVTTYNGINVRDSISCNISNNTILGTMLGTQNRAAIYISRDNYRGTNYKTIMINGNYIDITGAGLVYHGLATGTTEDISIINNVMKSADTKNAEPFTMAETINKANISNNEIAFHTARGIGFSFGTLSNFVIANNNISDTYGTASKGIFNHTGTFTGGKIVHNICGGTLPITSSDNDLIVDGNTFYWVNTNNSTTTAKVNVRNNRTTVSDVSTHGTFTTNSSGVYTFTNLSITKYTIIIVRPTSSYSSGFVYNVAIANNGSVTINTNMPSTAMEWFAI